MNRGCFEVATITARIPAKSQKTAHCRAAHCADIVATLFIPFPWPFPPPLPPRNRRNIRPSGRSSVVPGALQGRDTETNTATGSDSISEAEMGLFVTDLGRMKAKKNAPSFTWKQPRFGAFSLVSFIGRFVFVRYSIQLSSGTSGLPLHSSDFFSGVFIRAVVITPTRSLLRRRLCGRQENDATFLSH